MEIDDLRAGADPFGGVGVAAVAEIFSPRTASAWTAAVAAMVTILPLRTTRSAGWAKA